MENTEKPTVLITGSGIGIGAATARAFANAAYRVIVFLSSEGARYITGQVLVVDGGLLVGRY